MARGCLEVAAEFRQPVGIITKNALVLRDLDILSSMSTANLVHVNISITTLDAELVHSPMEPRRSTPEARLRAIEVAEGRGRPGVRHGGAGDSRSERQRDPGHSRSRCRPRAGA